MKLTNYLEIIVCMIGHRNNSYQHQEINFKMMIGIVLLINLKHF
jgi:hypothetical protein